MCSSGSRDHAISAVKSLLSTVHVGGSFRIENSKAEFSKAEPYPYFYLACKECRTAKCGVWQKGGGTAWTVKSVNTALGSACVGASVRGTAPAASSATPSSVVATAVQVVQAAVQALDVQQLIKDASPAKFQCSECREDFDEGALARCDSGTHRFCSTCFSRIVSDAVRGENQGVCIASKGLVPCNYCNPKSAFDMQKCAIHLSSECFAAWLEVMSGIRIAEESAKWAQEMKKKDDEHFAALCAAGLVSDEDLVNRHYKLIAETLICAACPRCGLYVSDFDACCVLQCGRRDGVKWAPGYGCGIYYCAWCLDASDDEKGCTEHVKLCRFNVRRGEVFPPSDHPKDWKDVMHELARSRVKVYIRDSVQPGLQEQVYNKVCSDNREIGLGLQPWGSVVSDGWRQATSARPPVQPYYEDNISTLLNMNLVNSRAEAIGFLDFAQNDLDQAVTLAMASRH